MLTASKRIALTQGQVAIVDAEDYPALNRHKWWAVKGAKKNERWRAVRETRENGQRIVHQMSRVVMELPPWNPGVDEVDHLNRDTLDNRKSNLRIVSHRINLSNRHDRSRWGTGIYQERGRFRAMTRVGGRLVHHGTFDTVQEAQHAKRLFLKENEL